MNNNNVTIRARGARSGWKRWRDKQTRLWVSFGNRLSKRTFLKTVKELQVAKAETCLPKLDACANQDKKT